MREEVLYSVLLAVLKWFSLANQCKKFRLWHVPSQCSSTRNIFFFVPVCLLDGVGTVWCPSWEPELRKQALPTQRRLLVCLLSGRCLTKTMMKSSVLHNARNNKTSTILLSPSSPLLLQFGTGIIQQMSIYVGYFISAMNIIFMDIRK